MRRAPICEEKYSISSIWMFFCKNKDMQCDFIVCAPCYTAMEKRALSNIDSIPDKAYKKGRKSFWVQCQSVQMSTRVQDKSVTTRGAEYKSEKEKTETKMKELYTATGEAMCVFDPAARELLHWTYTRLETITDTYWIDPAYHDKLRKTGQNFCLPTGCKQCKKNI